MNESILNKTEILERAKNKWNDKTESKKIKAGTKYQRFLDKFNFTISNWDNCFDELTKYQQNIIIKGELIRTYDSLPNISKTRIMRDFGLSSFSSKWYKLPSSDKKILLNHLIR